MTDADRLAVLRQLVETPGVPGREDRVRTVIIEALKTFTDYDEIRTDALGSLIVTRRARAGTPDAKQILVAAHMDQIGFLVSNVGQQGFLRLHSVGAFDARVLPGQHVRIVTEHGAEVPGVLMLQGHPIHTAHESSRKTTPELRDLYVDIGGDPKELGVRPGDMVTFATPFRDLGNAVTGPGLDDRIGCCVLIETLARVGRIGCDIHAVFTAQEELGSRGVEPLASTIKADIGIALDTIVAADTPGVPDGEQVSRLGDGAAILIADSSTLADMTLVRQLEQVAKDHFIASQRVLMEGGGQDGAFIQRSRAGVRTVMIGCPIRYMHTAGEIAKKTDIAALAALSSAFLASL